MQKIYSRINWENEPSVSTPLNEDNLNKIDYALDQVDTRVVNLYGYEERVKESETNAKESEVNAKTSEINAKQSELLAQEYAEEAFKGTPEGYQEFLDKVDALEIKTTKERTNKNTKHGGFRLTKMLANTVQNGTPSPSTPFPLLSTGDCVELMNGVYATSNGNLSVSNEYVCTKNPIPCKSDDVIKVTYDSPIGFIALFYSDSGYLAYSSSFGNKEATFAAPQGATYFNIDLPFGTSITPQTVGKITITINGKFLGCAKTHGKNLFNGVHKGRSLNASGELITYATYTVSDYIEVKPNTPYYFSNIGGSSAVVPIVLYDENKVAITWSLVGAAGPCSGTLTFTEENVKYIRVSAPNGLKTQVEVGTVATEYEPYRETVAYYLTQYPMIKGSTLYRENGLVKAIHTMKEITLTSAMQYAQYEYVPTVYFMNIKEMAIMGDVLFSHLRYKYANWNSTEDIGSFSNHETVPNIYFNTGHETLYDFYSWVGNNSPTLQYELATPIIETLDTASQIALNGLETFYGVTIVEFDTRVQPLEFEAEVGTSQVGAYTLKSLNNSESNAVRMNELAVALVSL